MMGQLPYDKTDPRSIESYACTLLGKSLRDVLGSSIQQQYSGKGKFGQIVEELFFRYKPNSVAGPDFSEAGLELKTTPLKETRTGFVSKERLVFNIIDYNKEHLNSFRESSFWKKNQLLLLMFYLHDQKTFDIDYLFKIIRLWQFPATDLKIIKDDWLKIISKIKAGKAHEISEGDTFYLGACTKGANRHSLRSQANSDVPAMQRAFSLKSKYLNYIIDASLTGKEIVIDYNEYDRILNEDNLVGEPLAQYRRLYFPDSEPVVKSLADYHHGETFEDLVIKKFENLYNHSTSEIQKELGIQLNEQAKSFYSSLTKVILGVDSDKEIEEFEKAAIIVKTVRLKENALPKEDISFPTFKYEEIVDEEWEESEFRNILEHRFLFVFFQFVNGALVLRKAKFWNMSQQDIYEARDVWAATKEIVKQGNIVKSRRRDPNGKEIRRTNFPAKKFSRIAHARPHASNAADTYPLPVKDVVTGKREYTKYCFWLNSSYIRDEVYLKP